MHINIRVTVMQETVSSLIRYVHYAKYSKIFKDTVLISNISIITFLNFAFYTQAAPGLETILHEAKARTHKAEARTHEA